jgi:hypothetical protein
MTDDTVPAVIRMVQMIAEEQGQPEKLFYISFADPGRFLGANIVKAPGFAMAIMKTHSLKINPGGEALGAEVPENVKIKEEFIDKLLRTKEEVEEAMGESSYLEWGDLDG